MGRVDGSIDKPLAFLEEIFNELNQKRPRALLAACVPFRLFTLSADEIEYRRSR